MNFLLKNIILIGFIILIVVLSQQPYFKKWGRIIYQKITQWVMIFWQKTIDFIKKHILTKFISETEKRQQIAKEELKEQLKKLVTNVWDRVKNYILELFKKLFLKTALENK